MKRQTSMALCAAIATLVMGCAGSDGATGTAPNGTNDTGNALSSDSGAAAVDGGSTDIAVADAGTPDAGTPDAGTPDAGTPDAGTPDAGTPDAGTPDAGTPDVGTTSFTWSNGAKAFFAKYCVQCHSSGAKDFKTYDAVKKWSVKSRCGVAPTKQKGCGQWPPPMQFPVGGGAKPSTDQRQTVVDWIDAKMPK